MIKIANCIEIIFQWAIETVYIWHLRNNIKNVMEIYKDKRQANNCTFDYIETWGGNVNCDLCDTAVDRDHSLT